MARRSSLASSRVGRVLMTRRTNAAGHLEVEEPCGNGHTADPLDREVELDEVRIFGAGGHGDDEYNAELRPVDTNDMGSAHRGP